MVGWLLRCPLVSSLRPLQIPQATAVQPVGGTLYAAVAARNATSYCKLWASDQNPCEARGWVLLGRAAHFAQRWLVRNQYVVGGYCRVVETLEEKRRKRNAPPPPPPPPEEEEELKRMAEEDGALQTNECPKLTCNTVTRGYMFDHEGKGHFNFTYTGIGPARPHTCYLLCRRTPGCAFWMYNMRSKRVQASPSEVSGALWLGLQPLSSSRLDVPEHSRVCLLDVQHAVQASPSEVSGALWLGLQPLSSSRLDVPEHSRVCLLDVQHAVQASPSEVSGALWLGLQPLSSSRLDVPEHSRVCLLDVQHAVQAREQNPCEPTDAFDSTTAHYVAKRPTGSFVIGGNCDKLPPMKADPQAREAQMAQQQLQQ
ncbi:unnamed protein product [Closterium sp. NIES-65]|nr:unnamed protein product [Closterium sp. NIES-65]